MSHPVEPAGRWVPDDKSFGARLALVRQRMGWNAKEAAIACGLPAQSWRNWESGMACRDQELAARKIAARTGCDYLWLFAGIASGVAQHAVDTPSGGAQITQQFWCSVDELEGDLENGAQILDTFMDRRASQMAQESKPGSVTAAGVTSQFSGNSPGNCSIQVTTIGLKEIAGAYAS